MKQKFAALIVVTAFLVSCKPALVSVKATSEKELFVFAKVNQSTIYGVIKACSCLEIISVEESYPGMVSEPAYSVSFFGTTPIATTRLVSLKITYKAIGQDVLDQARNELGRLKEVLNIQSF